MPNLVIRRGMKAGLQYRLNPERPRIRLGRDATNQVQILDKKASREHAEIVFDDGWFVVRDLGSSNGTWLNSDRLEEEKPLEDGDRIRIGGVILEFTDDADDAGDEIEDAEVIEEAEEIEGDGEAAEGEDKAPVEVSVEVEEAGDAEDAADVEVLAEVEEETGAKDSEDLEVLAEVEEETGAKDSAEVEVLAEVEEKIDAKGPADDKESGEAGAGREEKAEPALAATQLDQPGADAGGKASTEDDDDKDDKDDKDDDGQGDKSAEAEEGDTEPENDGDADGDEAH